MEYLSGGPDELFAQTMDRLLKDPLFPSHVLFWRAFPKKNVIQPETSAEREFTVNELAPETPKVRIGSKVMIKLPNKQAYENASAKMKEQFGAPSNLPPPPTQL